MYKKKTNLNLIFSKTINYIRLRATGTPAPPSPTPRDFLGPTFLKSTTCELSISAWLPKKSVIFSELLPLEGHQVHQVGKYYNSFLHQ